MRAGYPKLWLMTDERLGDALFPVLLALPPGSGVVFRHYSLGDRERRALFGRVRTIARARRLVLVVARPERVGRAGGVHGTAKGGSLRTWPAHDRRQAVAGVRAGAGLLFVSPVFPTRSHPGARAIGPARAAAIGRGLGVGLIALGGMDARRFRAVQRLGFAGWAAIDGLNLRPVLLASPAKAGAQPRCRRRSEQSVGSATAKPRRRS